MSAPAFRITLEPAAANGLRERSQIMVDKILTVPRSRVSATIGRLDDEMLLRLAVPAPLREAVATRAIERAHAASRVTPRVEFASASELYDPESQTKASRFVDRRPANG